jgi:beta-1,4-N-acetylglucosaminyltransferase
LIFLSVGTHEQPFERAIDLVLPLAERGEDILVQHGLTPPRADLPNFRWLDFIEYEEVIAYIHTSRAFVCHAGVGSILTSLMQGTTPIVLPREARYGEHIDDHQLQLASKLASRGLIVLVDDHGIFSAVERARAMKRHSRGSGSYLHQAVATAAEHSTRQRRFRRGM